MRGKNISKVGMILSVTILIIYNLTYLGIAWRIPTVEEQKSIIMFCLAIIIILSPIQLSIILDKLASIFQKKK